VHVPEFPKKPWPVTLRHLMAQVGGVTTDQGGEAELSADVTMTNGGWLGAANERSTGCSWMTSRRVSCCSSRAPGTALRATAGSSSAAVEAAAQEPFLAFMRRQVFEPLDMRDTTVDVSIEAIPDRAAAGHPIWAQAGAHGGPFLLRRRRRIPVHTLGPGAVRHDRQPTPMAGHGHVSRTRPRRRRHGQHFVRGHEVDCLGGCADASGAWPPSA
jgi:CubicO group peptidase (beta-lactamase class C family)